MIKLLKLNDGKRFYKMHEEWIKLPIEAIVHDFDASFPLSCVCTSVTLVETLVDSRF